MAVKHCLCSGLLVLLMFLDLVLCLSEKSSDVFLDMFGLLVASLPAVVVALVVSGKEIRA